MTQFLFSLACLIACGALLLVVVGVLIYRKVAGKRISMAAACGALAALAVGGLLAAVFLAQASVALARRGARALADAGQGIVGEVIEFGTVGVLGGVGGTVDHFQQKWRAQSLESIRGLEIMLLSTEERQESGQRVLVLLLGLRNGNREPVDLSDALGYQLILLKAEGGVCFPFQSFDEQNALLPPGEVSGRELKVVLPGGVKPVALVTPFQEVSLTEGASLR